VPKMELFDRDALYLGSVTGIWTRIWTYMLWPSDERRRRAYVLSAHADALAAIEKHAGSDPDYAGAHDIAYSNFRELGGWGALAHRWRSDMDVKKTGKPLRTAAAALDIIRKTPDGSLNKAVHIIDKTADNYDLIGGRTSILNAWKHYKTVAHLELALLSSGEEQFGECPRCLARFLAIAQDYQQFATTYIAPRQKGVLVDPSAIWAVPDELTLPAAPALQPLPDDMLKARASYEAPH
jgi:hypothetical protein